MPNNPQSGNTPDIYQLCLLPAAWPKVKEFIERQWPAFQVIEIPVEMQHDEELKVGIHTFSMVLK